MGASVSVPHPGPSPPAGSLSPVWTGGSVPASECGAAAQCHGSSEPALLNREQRVQGSSPSGAGRFAAGSGAPSGRLADLLEAAAFAADPAGSVESSPAADLAGSSMASLIADHRRYVAPVATRVNPDYYKGHHLVQSVLSRGLKLRIPASLPPVWRVTPSSPLMTAAIRDYVSAGVLRRGAPTACYQLFPVPKSSSVARLVYDLSLLTPLLPGRPH